jgi:chromosomal replication initiator protein
LVEIRGKNKTKEIVWARQVAIYLIHQHMKKTLIEIAQFFNKKDHTTIMHSLEVVKAKLKSDSALSLQLVEIEKHLS